MTHQHTTFPITADNFPIYVSLAAALVACGLFLLAGLVRQELHRARVDALARSAYYVSTASAAYALIYLLQCILSGARYDIAYVHDNSSIRDAFIYRVSALWAGQGGSLLLWASFSGLTGLFMIRKADRSSWLLTFWCSVQAFFLTLLVVDDPLKRLVDFQPGGVGLGMNPLLKNPWMAIHPPVVFVAYALLAVPAALAVQALIDGDAIKWVKRCLPWSIAGWLAMTAGLVLGMVWSYEVLGWGGYWGWDPVENASLVPWLLSTALVHGLVLQRQRGRMARWNVVLAFAVLLSVLYATFLTRSGVLSEVSVHAFGNAQNFRAMPVFKWLKWMPIAYSILCAGLLVVRWRVMSSGKAKPLSANSRDLALMGGVVTLCLFAVVVLVGTSFSTFNRQMDLKPSFYSNMSVPLALAAVALIALSAGVAWGGGRSVTAGLRRTIVALAIALVASIASAVIAFAFPDVGARFLLEGRSPLALAALVLLLGIALVSVVSSVIAAGMSSLRTCGAHVAHAGVALVVLGIVLSATGRSSVIDLSRKGNAANAHGLSFAYIDRTRVSDEQDILRVSMQRHGRGADIPLRVAGSERGVIMFPFISSSPLRDIYIAPDKILGNTVSPYLTWDGKGWTSHPVPIPGSRDSLELIGMQVEARAITLQYLKPGAKPIEFKLDERQGAVVEGYNFTFDGFTSSGKNMMESAGAHIGVSGHGLVETLVLRVSTKPLISLLWLGTIMIMAGGWIALNNRRRAKA